MGTKVGAVGRTLENGHSQFTLKEQFKAVQLVHNSFFEQILAKMDSAFVTHRVLGFRALLARGLAE